MTLNELINALYNNPAESITLEKNFARLGNEDGSGNYKIMEMKIGDDNYILSNQSGVWKLV